MLGMYTLTKELGISPKEVQEMPYSLARDLLTVHGVIEEIKAGEIDKHVKTAKNKMKI
jgi:hypothetical protein